MKFIKKYNLIFRTAFFSVLIFLGSFKISYAIPFFEHPLESILSKIANIMLWISSQILAIAGIFFNLTLEYTLNFEWLVEQTGMINIGWTIIRDMANMVFIFILISVAIGTILGLSGWNAKNSIKNIILAALFINFSLFITGVVIDASNIIAVGFYNATIQNATTGNEKFNITTLAPENHDKGISGIFSQALKISTIYDGEDIKEGSTKLGVEGVITHKHIFTIGLFGSLLMLITAFVFFSAAIMFIVRTVVLMFLMMTSPFAFVGMILPKTKAYAVKWWSELFNQAFFAPIYLMFIYIVAQGVTSKAFKDTLSNAGNGGGFANTFTGGGAGVGAIVVIFNFLLIIGLLLASLITAKSMGAKGADFATKTAGRMSFGTTAMLGQQTLGRGFRFLGGKLKETPWVKKGGFGSKLALKTLQNVGDRSFDLRQTDSIKSLAKEAKIDLGKQKKGGYSTKFDAQKKAELKYASDYKDTYVPSGPTIIDTIFKPGEASARKDIYTKRQDLKQAERDLETAQNTPGVTENVIAQLKTNVSTRKKEFDKLFKKED